jgi:hypothetical protein
MSFHSLPFSQALLTESPHNFALTICFFEISQHNNPSHLFALIQTKFHPLTQFLPNLTRRNLAQINANF